MVFIRETDKVIVLASLDQIISSDTLSGTCSEYKIPEPVIPENLTKGQVEVIKNSQRNITCIEVSGDGQFIAVATENKQLVVLNKKYETIKNILLQRISSKICFSPTNDILVADRTGDVYLYKLEDPENLPILLLGHLSVILDLAISHCGKYIATCDRDEKIRVSHYPNAYNIVTYCLGHTEFVLAIKMLKENNLMVSASGDGTVRVWNYLNGEQVNLIDTKDLVEESIFKSFCAEMDSEKVDITTLPVSDMQVYENSAYILIALVLYNSALLHIFKMEPEYCKISYLQNIAANSISFSFHFGMSSLYILSSKLLNFNISKESLVLVSNKILDEVLVKYSNILVQNKFDISVLYKRKYDNLQEYIDRKKQRLESK